MENHKGKSEINPASYNDQDIRIDLTLKLGQSVYDKGNHEEEKDFGNREVNGFSSMDGQSSYNMGNYSRQGGSTNLLQYQCSSPQNVPNRKRPNTDDGKICKSCGSNNTPLWRKGPDGPQTLCNACGLRHLRTIKRGVE